MFRKTLSVIITAVFILSGIPGIALSQVAGQIQRSPGNGASVPTLTPEFRWEGVMGAGSYFLAIYSDSKGANLAYSKITTVPSEKIPAGTLQQNKSYWWCVFPALPQGGAWGTPNQLWTFTTAVTTPVTTMKSAMRAPAVQGGQEAQNTQIGQTDVKNIYSYYYIKSIGEYKRDSKKWTGGIFAATGLLCIGAGILFSGADGGYMRSINITTGATFALLGGLIYIMPNQYETLWNSVKSGRITAYEGLRSLAEKQRSSRYAGSIVFIVCGASMGALSLIGGSEFSIGIMEAGLFTGLGIYMMNCKTAEERACDDLAAQQMSRLNLYPGYNYLTKTIYLNGELKF